MIEAAQFFVMVSQPPRSTNVIYRAEVSDTRTALLQAQSCKSARCSCAAPRRSAPPLRSSRPYLPVRSAQLSSRRWHSSSPTALASSQTSGASSDGSGARQSPDAVPCSPPQQQDETPSTFSMAAVAARIAQQAATTAFAVIVAASMFAAPMPAAAATDAAKVGTCLLGSCQRELAGCLADSKCAQNLICLQTCSGRPDETDCQIRCGDKYDDKAIQTFNACAVSAKKCVPQRVDEGVWPVPPDCALDTAFDLTKFTGRWYITAGLNPLFDTFPCQEHFFGNPEAGKLYGKINWRIPTDGGDFLERSTVQVFRQQENPALLWNHGNEYLNYEDDWYILASKPNEYVLIYYKGGNDAWKGYGGSTVYTREKTLKEEYVPEIKAAVEAAGLDWAKFQRTDNSCPLHPPQKAPLEELADDIQGVERFTKQELLEGEKFLEKEVAVLDGDLEYGLRSFGKGFTVLEGSILKEERELEGEISKELDQARQYFTNYEQFEQQAKAGPLKWLPFKIKGVN